MAFLDRAGESAYLSGEEWRSCARIGVETVAGRVPVIVGISEATTAAVAAKASYAAGIGAGMLAAIAAATTFRSCSITTRPPAASTWRGPGRADRRCSRA